jgi:DNA-binding MarR family transcriptional regulator
MSNSRHLPVTELPPENTTSAVLVLRQFRVVFNAVKTHFQQVEKQVGIGGAQVWALHAIHSRPGLSMNDLAAVMDIHQSTASNLVRQLVKRQLLRTEKSTTDRRSVMLYTEPAAQVILDRVPGPFQGVLPGALERLPPESLEQLHHHLGTLITVLAADEKAGSIPLAQL